VHPDDELKKAWKSQFSGQRLVLDEKVILPLLRRQQSYFRGALYGSDAAMVVLACGLLGIIGYLLYQSRTSAPPWALWGSLTLVVPIAGLAAFTTLDRIRQRRRHPKREDSVQVCAESMLAEVNHRIGLFRKVLWWFVLPIILVADGGFQSYVAWRVGWMLGGPKEAFAGAFRPLIESIIFGIAVYYMFQWMVRRWWEPYRQGLEALIQSLQSDDTAVK